ncbi:MAG: hypothetical protein AAFY70_01465 [Bacteroidota bacterium]
MSTKELLFLGLVLLLWGCNAPPQADMLPPCLQNPTSESFIFMRSIIDLHQDSSRYRKSIYMESGEQAETYEEWADIFAIDSSRYRETSLYNVYETPESKEYFLEIMELNTASTKRGLVRSLQFRTTADTAYPTVSSQTYFRYTGEQKSWEQGGRGLNVYLLEGFAHAEDKDFGNLKWWSPQLGTLLIWYGDSRYYQLAEEQLLHFPLTEMDSLFSILKEETAEYFSQRPQGQY